MKILIFDSSSIINMTMNGILDLLISLRKSFNGKFIIPKEVKYEIITRPLEIKKYQLGALKVQKLIDDKILEYPEAIGISDEEIKERAKEILRDLNHVFSAKNELMHIIDIGEAGCLALSIIASKNGIKNVIVIDERTTRMLGENPENLHKLFENKFHTKIKIFPENIPEISRIKFIRSSELVYVAWKKSLVDIKNPNILDALLYATKFKGSAISREEIEEIERF